MTQVYALVAYYDGVKGDTVAVYTDKTKVGAWIYYNSDEDGLSYDIEVFDLDVDPDPTP
jgi:hypothetical protein